MRQIVRSEKEEGRVNKMVDLSTKLIAKIFVFVTGIIQKRLLKNIEE